MALTLNATPGAADANSYATVDEADAYHEALLYATDWTAATTATKEAALVWATRLLDEQCAWRGTKTINEQALRWPRGGVYDVDGVGIDNEVIPPAVKGATAELARHLIKSDRLQVRDDARGGLHSVSAGPVSVTFDKVDRISLLPESVLSLLRPFATGSAGSLAVPLVRV
jgi:hypothetical protein